MELTSEDSRRVVKKLWGKEDWIVNSDLYCGKILTIVPGYRSSLHYHPHKTETFLCIVGSVCLEIYPEGVSKGVLRGDKKLLYLSSWKRSAFTLQAGVPHRFWTLTKDPALVVEFSTHHNDEDVVRLEPSGKNETQIY